MPPLRPRLLKIHLFASEPHYARHLRAVWMHLPPAMRGEERVGRAASPRGIPADDIVMVAGFSDIDRVPNHRLIYVEHGAGQTYLDNNRPHFYPGGEHPERVIGYISPRHEVAALWGRPAFIAGCPALDGPRVWRAVHSYEPYIAITFHWDPRRVCPEARSAREHWLDHLHEIVGWVRQFGFEALGHWHPRDREGPEIWKRLGVRLESDPDEVLSMAQALIADNTSLMYEAASLDIPVMALNAPWYRKDVHHGLRFWDAVPGSQFDHIDDLLVVNLDHYIITDPTRSQRHHAVRAAYGGFPDGHAGERAAAWVVELVEGATLDLHRR